MSNKLLKLFGSKKVQMEELNKKMSSIKIEEPPLEYENIIEEIINASKLIGFKASGGDGRIDSSIKELPFLNELKQRLLKKYPNLKIIISPIRSKNDIVINDIQINLKLTKCKSADNVSNKPSIYYSITAQDTYPKSSNWNTFFDKLTKAEIKTKRDKLTEYHYLVKNKINGDVLLKPIFDIHTYTSNASNDLQINWKNEFQNIEYHIDDDGYLNKVESLLNCLQKSVLSKIETTNKFATANIKSLLKLE